MQKPVRPSTKIEPWLGILSYIPRAGRNSIEICGELLRSGVFSAKSGSAHLDRRRCESIEIRTGKSYELILFEGPELDQSHATIFFQVLRAAGGKMPSTRLHFSASQLAREAGWPDSGYYLKRVLHVLEDLVGSTITFRWAGKRRAGLKVTLLSFAGYVEGELAVDLHSSILELFRAATWNVNLNQRKLLAEGIETWLYTFIRASTDNFLRNLEISHLHRLSRSSKDLKEFGRDLKRGLVKLKSLGFIEDFTKPTRSAYTVRRKRRTVAKRQEARALKAA